MTRVREYATRPSVKRPGLALLTLAALALLLAIGPILLLGAAVLLIVAWRAPERVSAWLEHRWLTAVPTWLRATPMRFAVALFVLTLPLAATNYVIRTGDDGGGSAAAAAALTPAPSPITEERASPSPARTPKATPPPRRTPRPTPAIPPTPTAPAPTPAPTPTRGGELSVHFLDVGQGDATLFVAPNATLLIDAGRHDRDDVVPHLRSLGVTEIDVVAITHGHADHIGQLDRVLGSFRVGEVWMSGTPHTTRTFERALTALERSSAGYEEPRAGDTTTIGSLGVEIVNPARPAGDIDADTLAMRVTYGSVSFLFTGDMEADVEAQVLARAGGRLASTVYQVGHHGSSTSTSSALLAAVRPEIAVYSAAAENQYGHPHDEVIRRLDSAGIRIYGTDTHGSVTVVTDGDTYRVETRRAGGPILPLAPQPPPPATTAPVAGPSGCGAGQVDINSAGFEALQQIIHIGPDRAHQILNLRPFSSVDSMERIDGIGPARLADIKEEGIACVP